MDKKLSQEHIGQYSPIMAKMTYTRFLAVYLLNRDGAICFKLSCPSSLPHAGLAL